MRRYILMFSLFCVLACQYGAMSAENPAPNIVLIISDDQAWTDYGFMGHPDIRTPHLDQLAAQGVVFRRGYVPTALCRPSLMTLATGQYAHVHGVTGNDPSPRYADPKTPLYAERRAKLISYIERFDTLPELLGRQGYLTHQSGKWWEGSFAHGGFTHGMTRGFPEPGGRHGDDGLKIGREGLSPIEQFVDSAVAQKKPFFLWYAPFLPHTPHTPPQRLLDKYQTPGRSLPMARYYAMCAWFDETCGQLLGMLDNKGVRDNTLVVYVTDNGWIQNPAANGYAPRSKQTPYEGGIRTPIIFSWPGRLTPGARPDLVSSIDLMPTILAAAGAPVPAKLPGLNLWPNLKEAAAIDREAIFGEGFAHDIADMTDPEASLLYRWCIEGPWKLLLTYDGEVNRYKSTHPRDEKGPQLFDLLTDPHEKKNVATEHPEVVARLAEKIADWYPVKKRNTQTTMKAKVVASASYVLGNDGIGGQGQGAALAALASGKVPRSSHDRDIPRCTFWDHRGTTEWVQYTFAQPTRVSEVEVYWFDDRPGGGCRVPASWRVLYDSGYGWLPVNTTDVPTVARDRFNRVAFQPIVTSGIRLEVRMPSEASGGILQWRVNGVSPSVTGTGPVGADPLTDAPLDYPRLRLTLAAVADTDGEHAKAAARAMALLDEHQSEMLRVRTQAASGDVEVLKAMHRLRSDMARIETAFKTETVLTHLQAEHPEACMRLMVQLDWMDQDTDEGVGESFVTLAERVVAQIDTLDGPDTAWRQRLDRLADTRMSPADPRWMTLYLDGCRHRRDLRMGQYVDRFPQIVFTKHHDIGGQHYAYTEDVSDSPYRDNNPFPNTGQLCLLDMDGLYGTSRVLLNEPNGLIRDPDVSYDGRRILFAWRKSMDQDDYHLYEMDAASGDIRQITSGEGVADYEGVYLPSGDILFNSSRCQQIVDCWWADVSNLYTCAPDGRFLRRLSFDQVHTNYPQVMPDGRVIYTRWDYNDRGQLYPQPLFQMNPDGTGQTEFYGNNSWFPTTILHARGIAGTRKVLCVLSGHHTYQKGKLAIIDPSQGRQEASGVQLIAPVRLTEAAKVDRYGYQGHQFQYPFPLSETAYLVTFSVLGSKQGRSSSQKPFGIYFMMIDGQRELLTGDPTISCSQPIPLMPRPMPPVRANRVDYRQTTGVYVIQDIYRGPGLAGIERGTIKRIRVVALEFRAAGIGSGSNNGPAGGALVSTPISINGAWDIKRVLGTAPVHEDGSAAFIVPARTPVYFQALDARGHAVQSMRSWSTLQPGETFSCVGCHEDKNASPPTDTPVTLALRAGPQPLEPSHGSPDGFSFPKLVQPILDTQCIQCHDRKAVAAGTSTLSLAGTGQLDKTAQKIWSDAYKALADRKYADWISPQSAPPMLQPYHAGAVKSKLITLLEKGHEGVKLTSEEMSTFACWIDLGVPFSGDYTEGMNPEQIPKYQFYLDKRLKHAARDEAAIQALLNE